MIEYLVRSLVDRPEDVHIEAVPGEEDGETIYRVRVAPGDIGKVLGKRGHVAFALRTLIRSAAMKYKRKVYLEILIS